MMFFTPMNNKGEPLRQRRGLGQGGKLSHQLDLVFGPFESEEKVTAAIRDIFPDYPPVEILLLEGRVVKTADLAQEGQPLNPPIASGPEKEFDGVGSA